MGRTSSKSASAAKEATAEIVEEAVDKSVNEAEVAESVQEASDLQEDKAAEVPSHVKRLMQLYPQYEEFWVTPNGFVHPKDAAECLLKDAKLYKNEFFQSK